MDKVDKIGLLREKLAQVEQAEELKKSQNSMMPEK